MDTFRLKRTGTEALIFEGELLASVNTPKHSNDEGERGYELALYSKSKGGFVASFEYLTTVSTEEPVYLADFADDEKDVENFFLLIEPCEYVDPEMINRQSKKHRDEFGKAMFAIYDGHVDVIFKALHEHVEKHKGDIKEPGKNLAAKKGVLGFLGPK